MNKLNLGCGTDIREGFMNLDIVNRDGVDAVCDIEMIPMPLGDNKFEEILAYHVLEHIRPWNFIPLMNDLWRIMKRRGSLCIKTPVPGSWLWWQDPTHYNGIGELTMDYFDPDSEYYDIYKPKPWEVFYVQRERVKIDGLETGIPIESYEMLLKKLEEREGQ